MYFEAQISKNMDLTNNEIDNITERHTKLRENHEKLKSEVEAQNKYNSDNQDSVDKSLKKLNEEKNAINSDIDMIRNDIRTNENSRKNQNNIFTNKLDQLKQKQQGEFVFCNFVNFKITFNVAISNISFRAWRDLDEIGIWNKN